MASLTHVCMWKEKGWVKVTAEEAARLHPGGTVSAHSGLFMCELCGQYVLLTDGGARVRHFRHSSSEKSKNCPERTFGVRIQDGYSPEEHELPIRITDINDHGFSLEMGFVQIPQTLLTSKLQITIKANSHTSQKFTYARERLNDSGITYLAIGNVPSECYTIELTGTSDAVHHFWPSSVAGIDPEGTVFDAATGKKLVYDADVVVGKKYYLLQKCQLKDSYAAHVTYTKVSRQVVLWEHWYIYEVVANDYDKVSAEFFLDYHCRLTERPISIQPVWPVYVESPYVIKHNQKRIVMHLTGDAPTMRVFPYAAVEKYPCMTGSVIEINCNNRQQLISAGRTKALQYTYFWKEPLNQVTDKPVATITDLYDGPVESGEQHKLPDRKILRIIIPYDGQLTIRRDEVLVEKRKLNANVPIEVDNIVWNTELVLRVGLDVIWRAWFCKERKLQCSVDEARVLRRLTSYAGTQISVPHTIGGLAARFSDYPLLRKWIYKCIRSEYMSMRAYHELQCLVKSIESNK